MLRYSNSLPDYWPGLHADASISRRVPGSYSIESESPLDRCWRKLRKLEARLGESYEKSKWMRIRTYDKYCKRLRRQRKTRITSG